MAQKEGCMDFNRGIVANLLHKRNANCICKL